MRLVNTIVHQKQGHEHRKSVFISCIHTHTHLQIYAYKVILSLQYYFELKLAIQIKRNA